MLHTAIQSHCLIYPPLAKATHAQGTVVLDCIIDKHGNITQRKLVSGHPLVVQAATIYRKPRLSIPEPGHRIFTTLRTGNTWVCGPRAAKEPNTSIEASFVRIMRLVARHFTTSIDLCSPSLYHPFP